MSSRVEADPNRAKLSPPLQELNMRVQVSPRSVCFGDYLTAGSGGETRWYVYAGAGRVTSAGRTVRAVTELDQDVASWFGKLADVASTPRLAAAAQYLVAFIAQGRSTQALDSIVRLARRSVSSLVLTDAVE